MSTPHTSRVRTAVRPVVRPVARPVARPAALTVVLLAGLLMAAVVALAPAHAAVAKKGPGYGPWSSDVAGVSARVAPASKAYARTYVQIRRSTTDSTTGDRQVRITFQKPGKPVRTSPARLLRPGALTTYRTATTTCGASMRLSLQGRARADAKSAWSAWKSFGATVTRSC